MYILYIHVYDCIVYVLHVYIYMYIYMSLYVCMYVCTSSVHLRRMSCGCMVRVRRQPSPRPLDQKSAAPLPPCHLVGWSGMRSLHPPWACKFPTQVDRDIPLWRAKLSSTQTALRDRLRSDVELGGRGRSGPGTRVPARQSKERHNAQSYSVLLRQRRLSTSTST